MSNTMYKKKKSLIFAALIGLLAYFIFIYIDSKNIVLYTAEMIAGIIIMACDVFIVRVMNLSYMATISLLLAGNILFIYVLEVLKAYLYIGV